MANEIIEDDKVIDKDNKGEEEDVEIDLDLEDESDGTDTDKDKKENKHANETPEQRSARLARMSDQHDKKHKLGKYAEKSKTETTSKKTDDLDYGQKAFLVANGIKGKAETALVKKLMKSSGLELEDLVEDDYFQAKLKDLRESDAATAAIPKGSKRTGNPATNSVEYWIGKGELPPASEVELRRKVVNARMAAEGGGSNFSKNPVQGRA